LDYTHDGSGNSTVYLPLILGKAKRILSFREILSGFIPFIGALVAGSLTFSVGRTIGRLSNTTIYLMDLHTMGTLIAAFVLLSLAICFLLQSILGKESY
jgi:hypothetical protein